MNQIIVDESNIEWFNKIPNEERNKTCNYYLKLGYLIANCSKTVIDPNSSIFDNLKGNIDEKMSVIESRISDNLSNVKTSIDRLTEAGNKSILKGNMGERLIENIELFSFDLTENECKSISDLNKNMRFNDPGEFCQGMGAFCPIYN